MNLFDALRNLLDPPKSTSSPAHVAAPPQAQVKHEDAAPLVERYAVVGEAQRNLDGSDRQRIIKECKVGDEIRLVREANNPYDENAVALLTARGRQIGYLERETAEDVAALMDDGAHPTAVIAKILGGTGEKPHRGVVIDVRWSGESHLPTDPAGGRGHFGVVGRREVLTLTLVGKQLLPSGTVIHEFKNGQGKSATWFATSDIGLVRNKTYRLRATVKGHSVYQGIPVTYITRCVLDSTA